MIRQSSVHVGAGSQDRKGVGRREKKRDRRGIDTTDGLMAKDLALLDTILVRHAFSCQCAVHSILLLTHNIAAHHRYNI
jgi:hypothetical protein